NGPPRNGRLDRQLRPLSPRNFSAANICLPCGGAAVELVQLTLASREKEERADGAVRARKSTHAAACVSECWFFVEAGVLAKRRLSAREALIARLRRCPPATGVCGCGRDPTEKAVPRFRPSGHDRCSG